jgi:uncharacterized protein (TIGR00251 family)
MDKIHSSPLQKAATGFLLAIKVTPRASQEKIGEVTLDAKQQPFLKIYVRAVAEDNKANEAVIALLSKTFNIAKSNIDLIKGGTQRFKILHIKATSKALEEFFQL